MKIKIVIADDHKMFREGIKALLQKEKVIEVCGDADNEQDILEIVETSNPDVVLMDIDMGETNGIELTRKIKLTNEKVNVLAVSMHGDKEYVLKILEVGAAGYIMKNAGKDEMLRAINCVSIGDTYLSKEVSKYLMLGKNEKSKKDAEIALTRREVEILKLIAQEFSNNEIAAKLFVSVRTIDTHRRNLMEKLSVKNTAGLVKYAFRNKMIE